MEQRPALTVAREHILHVTQAQQQLRPSVNPVTLESRCVRMIEPSDKQKQTPQTSTTSQSTLAAAAAAAITTAAGSFAAAALTTTATTAPEDTGPLPLCTESAQTQPGVILAKTPEIEIITIEIPSISAEADLSPTVSVPVVEKRKRGDTALEHLLVVGRDNRVTSSKSAPPSPSPLKTSDAFYSLPASPLPPSPTLSSASSGRVRGEESTDIVGGKRPLDEDALTLNVPDLYYGDEVKATQGSSSWSQPHSQRTRSATTTSKLSNREQLITGDQPFRDKSHSEGKLSVQFSLSPPKRDEAHVMEFFQEQEKSLQEQFLSLPKNPPRKQRSPSPNVQQKLGLEHLDNLVRLMQQLTSLKDENTRLRKRCDYLESTKNLLQAKKELILEGGDISPSGFTTTSAKQQKHYHHHYHHQKQQQTKSLQVTKQQLKSLQATKQQFKSLQATKQPAEGVQTRSRLSSAEDIDYLETVDSSSDQRPKQPKKAMHKRSFSTGSIEVDLLDSEVADISSYDKLSSKSKLIGKSGSKQKGKSSKWARVKKVLTGQKLYEDLNTTIKSLREFGKSTHFRYSSAGSHDPSVQSSRPSVTRTYIRSDSIPTFGLETDFEPQTSRPTYSGYQVMETTEALDLSSDIWMGPPDWWEEYETNKESATSASSDVSSVIEVTTMFLGPKSDDMSTSQTTSTSTSSSSSAATTTTTTFKAARRSATQESLNVESALQRRKSSPVLSLHDDEEDDASLLEELASRTEPMRFLHKSSSCKSAELELPKTSDSKETAKKLHKTAWGRVKDIIHTSKGSIKRKPRKDKSGMLTEPEELSEVDMDALLDESWHTDLFAEGLLSRSTPKSSPMVIRQTQGIKGMEPEARVSVLSKSMSATSSMSTQSGGHVPVDMAALLGRSMSDDFNKKMQQWEEMKSKKVFVRDHIIPPRSVMASSMSSIAEHRAGKNSGSASVDESEVCSLDASGVSQELRTIDLKDLKGSIPEAPCESLVTEDSNTSIEVVGLPSVHAEDMTKKKMTESFSRKMQEWERMKYKGSPGPFREASPEIERKGSKGRKEERQKSKRSREEKEKEKLEKQREREMQKVEREQVKLDKEKLRIEKERLRALEREAKLEKLKGRLSQTDSESFSKNPVLSPLAEYKVTADFAHKLHEWELRKGLSHAVSNSVYLEDHKKKSMHQLKEGAPSETSPRQDVKFTFDPVIESQDTGSPPSQPYWDSPDNGSPVEKFSETSVDETSVTDECKTTSNIPTMERANAQLLQELRKKELEYHNVQEEVQNLNQKLANVKEEHAAEMARFHQELKEEGTVAEPVKLEMGELERTMGDVEEKIKIMESVGESIAKSMESAAVGKWQSIEGEESVHMQLVELVAQMRNMLIQATQSEEASQKTSALTSFEVLYSQAMKLQVQMNNLRLSHLERNREIMVIKRQLLLQEVNNLVLQADITRREAELYQFHQAKRFSSSLRRWNTFSGHSTDRQRPQAQIELPASVTKPKISVGMTKSMSDREEMMQRFHEQGMPATTMSAPCSPLAQTTDDEEPSLLPREHHVQSQPDASVKQESTDRPETHTSTPEAARRQEESSHTTDTHKPDMTNSEKSNETPNQDLHTSVSDSSPTQLTSQDQTSPVSEESKAEVIPPGDSSPKRVKEKDSDDSSLTEYKTNFDSVPLQQEIEALRKEKAKVEKGSPTLIRQKETTDSSPVPSPGQSPKVTAIKSETLTQTIPKQSCLDVKPRLRKAAQIIDDDFPTAKSVMECTEHSPTTDHTLQPSNLTRGAEGESLTLASPPSPSNLSTLPPIADQPRAGSRSPRSPVSKHKLLRRQKEKEERETKSKDYSAISPKGSPVAARGKPPLPRQDRAVRHSPSSSPSIGEKGIKSKSHGDVDNVPRSPTISKPLQDAINKFEKRATICETEDRPVELRKTPSPTLHLPRVGLVSRVRKLKPAAELLEESQRYRSGQSIYATRIFQKYLPKDERKPEEQSAKHNKENVSGSYVHAMVQRLSRESTPVRSAGSSRTTSESSLHWTDTPRSQSEFVSHIVRKLSSSSGPESPSNITPLGDLTNEGQVKELASVYASKTESVSSSEKMLFESDKVIHRTPPSSQHAPHERRSCEVAMVLSSKTSTDPETSYCIISAVSTGSVATCHEASLTTVTSVIPTNHKSLPSLSSPRSHPTSSSSEDPRARKKSSGLRKDVSFEIEPDFSSITSSSSVFRSPSEEEREDSTKRSKEKRKKGDSRRLLASLSPVRRGTGRGKMETVGVLCKQSISFDLGVSMHSKEEPPPSSKTKGAQTKPRKPRSWDPSESVAAEAAAAAEGAVASTSKSTSAIECGDVMEGEIAPSSPTSTEKKKSKRFLDSTWLQKSKRFFKVSK